MAVSEIVEANAREAYLLWKTIEVTPNDVVSMERPTTRLAWFLNLADARQTLAARRPTIASGCSALGYVTPEEFARADLRRVEKLETQQAVSL